MRTDPSVVPVARQSGDECACPRPAGIGCYFARASDLRLVEPRSSSRADHNGRRAVAAAAVWAAGHSDAAQEPPGVTVEPGGLFYQSPIFPNNNRAQSAPAAPFLLHCPARGAELEHDWWARKPILPHPRSPQYIWTQKPMSDQFLAFPPSCFTPRAMSQT